MPSRTMLTQAAVYAVVAVALLAVISGVGPGMVVGGGGGDFPSIAWGLWRAAEALPGLPSVQTDLIFAPRGASIFLADLPETLLLAPLTALVGPVATFNLLQLAHPALAMATMFLLLRTEGRGAAAAAGGGAAFGLSPTLLTGIHNGNPDVTPLYLLPLVALAVRRLDRSWAAAGLAGVLIGLCPWFNPYVGVMAAVVAVVMASYRRPDRLLLAAGIALAVAGVYASLVLSSFSTSDAMVHKPGGPTASVPAGVAHLKGFFLPVLEAQRDDWSLHGWYLGALGLLTALLAGRGELRRPLLLLGAGLALSMGPVLQVDTLTPLTPGGWRIALPGALLVDLPGISALRIAYRFAALVALGLAPLIARGIDRLPRSGRPVLAVLIAVELLAVGAPLLEAGPRPSTEACDLLAEHAAGPVIDLPSERDEIHLLTQSCHGFPVAQGINQPYPRAIQQAAHKGTRAFNALSKHEFRYLILHFDQIQDEPTRQQLVLLKAHAESQGRILGQTEQTVLIGLGTW
ncbi:MAG: hypothetical protein P8R54_05055 [Myxococcota bacterium]|nr:hypothetical protein [Myxococcota bacterium]